MQEETPISQLHGKEYQWLADDLKAYLIKDLPSEAMIPKYKFIKEVYKMCTTIQPDATSKPEWRNNVAWSKSGSNTLMLQ